MTDAGLAAWLARLEQRAPAERIKLGLERVNAVRDRLKLGLSGAVISVAGTNGKGSVVAMIESVALAAGWPVLAYTSPHLHRFEERLRLSGRTLPEAEWIAALEAVESARGSVDLSYFEHTTLAALWLGMQLKARLNVLEVGLGGRLDAVNCIDPDVAVLTSIGLDHRDWLGPTRLSIAREKLGIARSGRPLIIGERRWPAGFDKLLDRTGAQAWCLGREIRVRRRSSGGFSLTLPNQPRRKLPQPALVGDFQIDNAACALAALARLAPELGAYWDEGLMRCRLPGRFEIIAEAPQVIVDVAHNTAAARALACQLRRQAGPAVAVFAALADKDITAIARCLADVFTHWYLPPLGGPRSVDPRHVAEQLRQAGVAGGVDALESWGQALELSRARAGTAGRVVVFGSFLSVAAAREMIAETIAETTAESVATAN